MALPGWIPLEVLFGNPQKAGPRLSPCGKRIAYIAPDEGVLNVWVRTLGEEDDRVITHDRGQGIFMHTWAQKGRSILYIQDREGDENWHLFSVDLETGEERNLTPFPGVRAGIIKTNRLRPEEILIGLNKRDPRFIDAFLLNVDTGDLTLEAENPGDVSSWIAGQDLVPRGVLATLPGGAATLKVREEDGTWKELARFELEDADSSPVGFSSDGTEIFVLDSRDRDTTRAVAISVRDGSVRELFADPEYDVMVLSCHPETGDPQMAVVQAERRRIHVLDPDLQPVIDAFAAAHKGDYSGSQRDLAGNRHVGVSIADDGPICYFLHERSSGETSLIFQHRDDLDQHELASMRPISYPARDGLTIHGYLTLPLGVPSKGLPLVLSVHGGPYWRDMWEYNEEAQWLANRGYACLQLNYRGSTGYGKAFLNAGHREWGGKMHDDLIDGVEWAVKEGFADPDRVGIYGWSYGGYAALAGAAFTPDVFRCAISGCGPSNLVTFLNTIPPYWETWKDVAYDRIGHPVEDEEFLKSRSPLFHAEQIRIPMMIVQGANDPRVVQAESEQIVEALKERGHPVEYLLYPDEGHGLMKPENRLRFYQKAERFLSEHLGGRVQEEGQP